MKVKISNCPISGKKRFVVESIYKKTNSGDVEVERLIDYYENDEETRTYLVTEGRAKEFYQQKKIFGSTVGSFINPITKAFVPEGTPGSISEIEFIRSTPLIAYPPNIVTRGDLSNYEEVQAILLADANGVFD
jgi:hypothetical protein